jgi:Family of unknown function (DUF5519)
MSAAFDIRRELVSWAGVETAPHRFGGIEFRVGRHELGHLHGDRVADLPFPRGMRGELLASGKACPHDIVPESGWVSVPIDAPDDVPVVIELFRLSYDRARRTG